MKKEEKKVLNYIETTTTNIIGVNKSLWFGKKEYKNEEKKRKPLLFPL